MISKVRLFLISFFLLLFLFSVLFIFLYLLSNREEPLPKKACFQNKCFSLEVANTLKKRAQGLMFRKELARNQAMLFIFPKQGIYNFWMKNTLIPLDIVWLNQNKEVVFIKHNALPCKAEPCGSIKPNGLAKYVLEINGGQAQEMGLKNGDKFYFKP